MRRPSPRPRALACALALLAAVVLLPPTGARADGIDDQQKQVAAALKAANADLDDADSATVQAAAQLSAVQAQLTAAQVALAASQRQLVAAQQAEQQAAADAATAQSALRTAEAARADAAAQVAGQQQAIDAYAVAVYETGATPEALSIVAATRDPSDFVQRLGLLDRAADGQHALLVSYQAVTVRLQDAQQAVAQRTAALLARQRAAQEAVDGVAASTAAAKATADRLAGLQAQRVAVLAHAESALTAQRSRVAQLTAESNQIAALLRARASRGSGVVGRGGLLWPATGPVTSPFGYRKDPVTGKYALHAGVDIGAPEGAEIHAAKAGTVIFAGQETGYGNYTCIDHGGGFSTCYAHQSRELVHVGQVVARGQVIGLVGHTGYATGPHLHFETRVNGDPVNPMQYF